MGDEYITLPELALLLGAFGTPSYLLVAGAVYMWLRRAGAAGARRRAIALTFGAATVLALPLTVLVWAASSYLPDVVTQLLVIDQQPLAFFATVGVPALVAALICFPPAGWLIWRRARRAP
jgi:hypothetical protein